MPIPNIYITIKQFILPQIGLLSFSLKKQQQQIYSFNLNEYIDCNERNICWEQDYSSLKIPHNRIRVAMAPTGGSPASPTKTPSE